MCFCDIGYKIVDMALLQWLKSFFAKLFPSGQDAKKKQELKKTQQDLRSLCPAIFKSGMLQANFAQVLSILCKNTKPIDDILQGTIHTDDVAVANRFKDRLILTGLSGEAQQLLVSLEYKNREAAIEKTGLSITRFFEEEHKKQDKIIKELNSPNFEAMDKILIGLECLCDVCSFNYINAIHIFDPNYTVLTDYTPVFPPMPLEPFCDLAGDLYYITKDFSLTKSLGAAVLALAQLKKGSALSVQEKNRLNTCLKTIATIFKKVLTPQVLEKIAILAKHDTDIKLDCGTYTCDRRKNFIALLQTGFISDENRLKMELKDRTITNEIKELFGEKPLLELKGYNTTTDERLRQGSPSALLWVTPLQITKTFLSIYYDEHIQALLNDIVIEGFFENPDYKTDFSSVVFSCNEAALKLSEFENTFDKGGKNDLAIMLGYIRDSDKDAEFLKKLSLCVDNVNVAAKELIQQEAQLLFSMHKLIGTLLSEYKSSVQTTISNLKLLFNSSRNKDNATKLEREYKMWKVFLEIMKNYAIIGEVKEEV